MGFFVDLLYALTLALIRTYKFCELGFLKFPATSFQRRNIHVKINNVGVFPLIANRGSLGVGEEYMNGGWEVLGTDADVSEVFYRLLVSNTFDWYFHPLNRFLYYLEFKAFNLQTRGRAFQIAEKHYDLGNDFFESFLDPWMQYSSAYWAKADNLNDAQLHKLELIAKKLDLKPGMRVLDVGCGWGTLCKYLAENYGVDCVGISVSKEGIKYAKKTCEGLKVDLRLQDYRELDEKFDRIVSIECLFHLGRHNHNKFFKIMNKCLKDDGILLLQVIGTNHKNMLQSDPFTHKYTFPNTYLPYYRELTKETEGLFIIEDWHSLGLDFAKTWDAWQERFQHNWETIKEQYDERFYKLWNYNISYASAAFKSRKVQLWQIVFSKDGLKREYRAAR
ncbi:Cyclopropane-fatty-acyl-phospholipid synthase [Orchesella cincta]|uniref:Cyclopropane-fatty-acyl-phospholipid synthase n=1 Tax=Orchesella cincta TaxID=48709 RepID=A0A1D2M912_ORCCI|nr:Cyclopropane-fatty-acyl-phospholipid synthase [Orchesella cincta]